MYKIIQHFRSTYIVARFKNEHPKNDPLFSCTYMYRFAQSQNEQWDNNILQIVNKQVLHEQKLWRSQGFPGWASRPPGGPKWGKKISKVWGKIRKIYWNLSKKWGKWNPCPPGIPSYVRGIKYPGIFRSYHPENTPRSSRILRQLVCTDTCMGFNGISESFFHLRTPYEALFVHNVLLYCNKYLFIPTLYGNLKFHNYSIHTNTIPNTAGSEHGAISSSVLGVFHWEPPNSEKRQNSQQTLTYDNFLFLIDLLIQHSPDLWLSWPTIIISFFFSAKVLPTENSRSLVVFSSFA